MPSSLEEIEYSAFDNCRSLKFIELPNNIKKLGSSIFNITSIKSIVVPPYAELDSTFNECKNIESVILSEGLETIGPYTFYSCSNLKSVKLPNSLKNIDNSAFAFCSKLISINLPENISYIGPRAFDCTPIESANLSKNLIDIEEKAFSGTKLKNIIIPNNIKKIKTKTFSYCSLESITIPSSVEYIDEWAFDSCKNLKTVNILGNTTKISSRAFDNCPNASIIYHGSKQDLKHNIFFPEWDDEHLIKLPQNIVYKAEDQNLESILAESFEKTIKNLQKEGLFENVSSFDLNFTGRGINIKLNENTNVMPSVEELDELETKFYNLVGACEKNDYEYRSKYSNIYLVYYDNSEKYPTFDEDGHPNGGKIVEKFPSYSLDEPKEALNGKGRLAGVMCEYLAQEADPKDLFMSKLKRNNFIKKFCDKYHLTPMFYIGSRDRGDKEWDNNWLDICSDISAYFYWIDHPDDSDDSDNFEYEEGVIIGPFGEEEYWSD